MSKVQFNENEEFHLKTRTVLGETRKPKTVDWLEKKGIVKSERSAQIILIIVIIVCFGLAGVILANQFGGNSSEADTDSIERSGSFGDRITE